MMGAWKMQKQEKAQQHSDLSEVKLGWGLYNALSLIRSEEAGP